MKYDKIGPTERNERNWLSLSSDRHFGRFIRLDRL